MVYIQKVLHTIYGHINMAWAHTMVMTMNSGTREDSTGNLVVSVMCYFARKKSQANNKSVNSCSFSVEGTWAFATLSSNFFSVFF